MSTSVLLAGDDLPELLTLVMQLGPERIVPIILESRRPVERLVGRPMKSADAAIVCLRGDEDLADFDELFSSHPHTRFIFLVKDFPLSAALGRLAAEHRSKVVCRAESTVVTAATIEAMMSATGTAA